MSKENNFPQISIIIPMYNVEEYVGECLDSILVQTFKDYEVIIVDDCSTDNSCDVVESYMSKFNGKLNLIKSKKNSGGCAVPRNIGLSHANGKYIFFLDSDDLIVKTGLAELYKVAEDYQADVIQCEKFYTSDVPKLKGSLLSVKTFQLGRFVNEPTRETDNIAKRIEDFHNFRYVWTAWSKLIRHSFLKENDIKFPETYDIEDVVFTLECISCAKRYVRVPNIVNIYRYRPNSILHTKTTEMIPYIQRWLRALINGFSCCNEFLSKLEFFQQNPSIKYIALDSIVQDIFRRLKKIYQHVPPAELDSIIHAEFENHENSASFAAFFFNLSMMYEIQLNRLLNNNNNFV